MVVHGSLSNAGKVKSRTPKVSHRHIVLVVSQPIAISHQMPLRYTTAAQALNDHKRKERDAKEV